MDILKIKNIEDIIIELRDEKIILDSDVARIYEVATKEVNQAVSNNMEKFPDGYFFELTKEEKSDVVKKFDHLEKIKYSPYMPKAFTEKGLYMLATILKSKTATQTTLAIIETFSKIRELSRNVKQLETVKDKDKQKSLMRQSGEIIADILDEGLETDESETTIELNLAVLKFRHKIKKKK